MPDPEVGKVVDRLGRRLGDSADLALALTGAGAFSRRAVWLGVTGDVAPLRALARVGGPGPRPPLPAAPHRRPAARRTPTRHRAVAALSAYAGPGWTAGAVHLVRSQLGPSPTYDDIASWPLTPRP